VRPSPDRHLERAANLAVIVAAIVCLASWLWFLVGRSGAAPVASERYQVGESLADVPELGAIRDGETLVVFVNSLCQICAESMPFYRALVQRNAARAAERRSHIAFVSLEPIEILRAYAVANGLDDQDLISLPAGTAFKMTMVPTILLLDSSRVVKRVWTGRLSRFGEDEVLTVVD
jgi:hypothetical protein